MKQAIFAAAVMATALTIGSHPIAQSGARAAFAPVTDAMLQKPRPADWLMWRRTLDSWGYSALEQINRNNVRALALAWSRALGPGIQEGTPLVYNGVMYFPNPNDLTHAQTSAGHRSPRPARVDNYPV
jgi:alcohol dehydrogenase (cytochrome c)